MKVTLRVILGAMLGIVAWVVSFFLFEFLVVASVWPVSWRMHYPELVINIARILAVTPCVIALGAAFSRMFDSRRALLAIAAMSVALVVVSWATMFPPGSLEFVVLPLLLGPALVAYVLSSFRTTNRGRGA